MRQFLIDLTAIFLTVIYGASVIGCACIAQNRDCDIAVLPISIIPVINTAYTIYRWDDCKWSEMFEGCKTNLKKGVENL